jgi:NIMA (never in mitosis gene a)-related kinase
VALLQKRCTLNNFEDLYMPMEVLGKGSFATVYKVRRMLDQEIMAAKYYCRDVYLSNPHKDKFVSMIRNEVTILREIDHQGIIKVHEMYQMPDKVPIIINM